MFYNESFKENYIVLNEIAFQRKMINELDGDYRSISNLRVTCQFFKNLICDTFPEMCLWQERSWKKYTLQEQIACAKLGRAHMEVAAAQEGLTGPAIATRVLGESRPFKLSNFLIPVEAFDTPLRRKNDQIDRLERELKRVEEMCKGICTLLDEKDPITKLVGGCKKMLLLPEVDTEGILPRYSPPIQKGFDANGNLSILISDQGASIFELKISRWEMNAIFKMSWEGSSFIRQFNNTKFCDEIDTNFKCEVLTTGVQPYWTITQVIGGTRRAEKPFSFGLGIDVRELQYLEGAIQRTSLG